MITQTPVPEGYKIITYHDSAPEPEPSVQEQERGYILFSRPITEPVYPESKPLSFERIEDISSFSPCAEFNTMDMALYPLRSLGNLNISVSDLKKGSDVIPFSEVRVRRVAYWYVKYPMYHTKAQCMRMPEYLCPAEPQDAPEREPQRYWLTIEVPEDTPAGVYTGNVSITHEGQTVPHLVPLRFRVLPFKLARDPAKEYSSYNYSPYWFKHFREKGEKFLEQAARNDFKAMRDYGITSMVHLNFMPEKDAEGRITGVKINYPNVIDIMREFSLKPPLPLYAGSVFAALYKQFTGKDVEAHFIMPEPPPDEVFEEMDRIVAAFKQECVRLNYPEIVVLPYDEIAPQEESAAAGAKLYRIFKKHGFKTYATKDPVYDKSAVIIGEHVDYWNSQPFSKKYAEVVSDTRHGYWCYPNHNAYEIKDPLVMCKGGRMTYGYGFWRSGYARIEPWIWRSYQQDHLAPDVDSGGNRMEDDGSITMTTYWECFREGIIDASYIYTLQSAIIRREGGSDAELNRLISAGRALLQDIWDSIRVQQKYLKDGMWASTEFDARRWEMALIIGKLLEYPELNDNESPSVIVEPREHRPGNELLEVYERELSAGTIEELRIDADEYKHWKIAGDEAKIGMTTDVTDNGAATGLFQVDVDHERDGENPTPVQKVGWPRMILAMDPPLDLTLYDFFFMRVWIDSNRDEVADDRSEMFISAFSDKKKFYKLVEIFDEIEQRQWHTILFPVSKLIAHFPEPDMALSVGNFEIGIRENRYRHGDIMKFYFGKLAFLKMKNPVICSVDVPRVVTSSERRLVCSVNYLGRNFSEGYVTGAELSDLSGKVVASSAAPLSAFLALDMPTDGVEPGVYNLRVDLKKPDGTSVSEWTGETRIVPGPFDGR